MPALERPYVLVVLDGFGYRQETYGNAIAMAKTPLLDKIWQNSPHTLLSASGVAVGLPEGQMGNSEVGHLCLGAGRVVEQSLVRINHAIENGSFCTNPAFVNAIKQANLAGGNIHILGLLSAGGVHSHEQHIIEVARMARQEGAGAIYIHAFLDGRDTLSHCSADSLATVTQALSSLGNARIASIIGRYYAMDRDNRWQRTQCAWQLLVEEHCEFTASDPIEGLNQAYERGESDEFVRSTAIVTDSLPMATIGDGDSVLFMNFRADRARQLSYAFMDDNFNGFARQRRPKLANFTTLTHYADNLKVPCAFPPQVLNNTAAQFFSENQLTQFRIAETEKYPHVTFFFNGGVEVAFNGETRKMIPSPKVATYDLAPEMSADEVTEQLNKAILSKNYDFILCNYANCDMVGHSGDLRATIAAVEAVDSCLAKVVSTVEASAAELLITADHGNAESMLVAQQNEPSKSDPAHSCAPVPLIYYGNQAITLKEGGSLADVIPTLLQLMGLPQPAEMSGNSLIQ